jgi:hypothetical protein
LIEEHPMAEDDWQIAPPPFKPEAAMATLRRTLRDAQLTERAGGFEHKGRRIVELALGDSPAGSAILAKLVKRPAMTPEYDMHRLTSHADLRRFTDLLKRQLARWQQDNDS